MLGRRLIRGFAGRTRGFKRLNAIPKVAQFSGHLLRSAVANRRAIRHSVRGNRLIRRGIRAHSLATRGQLLANFHQLRGLRFGLRSIRQLF